MQREHNDTFSTLRYESDDDTNLTLALTTGNKIDIEVPDWDENQSVNHAPNLQDHGVNFWVVWGLVFATSILIVIVCFYKYYDEPDTVIRHSEPQQRPFKATDNYPGPPNVGGKMMGSVRCPSYSRAVRGLHNADRSPPPDYKSNRNDLFILDSVRSVITDSFASWFSTTGQQEVVPGLQGTPDDSFPNQRTPNQNWMTTEANIEYNSNENSNSPFEKATYRIV